VWLLSRSLYGLKQAPRAWYQRIASFLHQLGFRSTRFDASLFVYRQAPPPRTCSSMSTTSSWRHPPRTFYDSSLIVSALSSP
jgi:hypothetical protein